MRIGICLALVAVLSTGACSTQEKRKERKQEELREFAQTPKTRATIAKSFSKSQMSRRTPELQAVYAINGRWNSSVVESDRKLDLSFGMDGVVVVNLISPIGSVAYAQGRVKYLENGDLKGDLASPPASMGAYSTFVVHRELKGFVLLIGDRRVPIFKA